MISVSDGQLVENAVRNAGRLSDRPAPRWHHVAEALAIGSSRAKDLCLRFGLDPDEERGSPEDDD